MDCKLRLVTDLTAKQRAFISSILLGSAIPFPRRNDAMTSISNTSPYSPLEGLSLLPYQLSIRTKFSSVIQNTKKDRDQKQTKRPNSHRQA